MRQLSVKNQKKTTKYKSYQVGEMIRFRDLKLLSSIVRILLATLRPEKI